MAEQIICHLSRDGGIDDKICKFLNIEGMTKEDVSLLRDLYDMSNTKPLISALVDEESIQGLDLADAAYKLMEFKNSQVQQHLQELKKSTHHMAKTFNKLYHVDGWNEITRRNRINMIASEFTREVSRRQAAYNKAGISLTREQIVNGYKSNGKYQDGQFSIFDSIFDKFANRFKEAKDILNEIGDQTDEQLREYYINENNERAEDDKWSSEDIEQAVADDRTDIEWAKKIVAEYPKIFQNWAGLCTFARMSLRDTESLKLGQTLEYAAPTSPDNFSIDSPIEDTYDLEESVRDAWMVKHSQLSAFSSLGTEVRRFLATISDVDDTGKKITDDLGYEIKMDPLEMHTYLAELLRGVTSESRLIKKLQSLSKTDPKVKAVFEALAKASQVDLNKTIDESNKPKNPTILTQLLLDMHKNMVPYSALVKRIKDGVSNIYVKILNNRGNPLHDEFALRMELNQQLDNYNSVYDNKGKVNWEALARWNVESKWLFPDSDKESSNSSNIWEYNKEYGSTDTPGFWNKDFSYSQRIDYMKRAAIALGVPMTDKTARRIYNNKDLRKKYLTALREFRTETKNAFGGDKSTIGTSLEVLEKYKGIRPSESSGYTVEAIEEYDNALKALNNYREGKGLSYSEFRSKKYGSSSFNSKGAGNDRIIKMLNILADVDSRLKIERRVPWFDKKGKVNSRYSDRTPSYMGDMVDKIHEFVNEGDAEGLKAFIMDKWGESTFFYNKKEGRFLNRWIQELYDSIGKDSKGNVIIDPEAMAKVFAFDEFLGSNIDKQVSIFENFTERKHAEAMIKQFVQLLDQSKGKSGLAKYPCFILGDSGAQMFFTARRYYKTLADVPLSIKNRKETFTILQGIKDVFSQEIERINYVKATNKFLEENGYKVIENFSQTANEFTMLRFLNPDFAEGKYWKILTGNVSMTDAAFENLSKEEALNMAIDAKNTDALEDAIQAYMNDAKADFMEKLVKTGVLVKSKNEDGSIKYTDAKGYFRKNSQWFNNSIENLIEDFFWNTKYATIQQLQFFTVDPAFYDHRYPVKDLQKRYKEIYAPGKGVSIEARDYNGDLYTSRSYETAVYFDDIAVSSEAVNPYFFNLMKTIYGENSQIVKAYTNNTLTDGQGYRSLTSYRAVMGMAGQWTMAMEEAYNRINTIRTTSGRQLTEGDIKEIAQLAVIFQPIKPYFYGLEKLKINDDGDVALVPVQHKYAEIVLIPELMQEGKLKDMAKWMEDNDVDLVASTKCVKVGSFGSTKLKGANTTEDINTALSKAFVHKLSWSDYRIQSGVPEHLNHAQLFGTQIRKLFLANIIKEKNYDYLGKILGKSSDPLGPTVYIPGMGNVHLTGRNLISFYNSLIIGNLFDSYDLFEANTSTNQNLSDRMVQDIISNSNQAEDNAFGFSIIDEGENKGQFVIPPGEPGLEHDASGLLLSILTKLVNKQKIKGGSAVQASAMGLSGYEESGNLFEVVSPEGDNVLYDEIEMAWNLSYTAATGKKVPLKFEDWCYTVPTDDEFGHHEAGDLKLSNEIVYGEDAREYLSWPVSGRNEKGRPKQVDKNGYDPNGYYKPLIETKYKGILDIIAYRIPTERDYSIINCKIFRFSNALSGGTLKVPSSRTTTAGFDFDIDKLYFFMREFAQTHLSEKQIEDIWSKIYELEYDENGRIIGGNEIYNALTETRRLDNFGKEFKKSDLEGVDNLNQNLAAKDRLFDYWESAGLDGTPEEAFTKYLEDHRDEYPIFDTYDPTASPLNPVLGKKGEVVTKGNSRVARNNMLIDLIRARLMDKETLRARYTPGGFESNRDAALRMRVLQFADKSEITENGHISWSKVDDYVNRIKKGEIKDPEPEYDVSDPTAILVYNQQNQIASKLIGIFANQNTNHAYASTMYALNLVEPIKFGNHTTYGLGDFLRAPEGVDVDTNVAEYLAASVDAVKDPVLNFLNLNLTTANAGALLARIGYTPQEIGLLFNQPIVKDICNYIANEDVTTDVAITKMLKQYGGKDATMAKISFDSSQVTSERLADNIITQRDVSDLSNLSGEFKRGQLQVLWLFNELMADAEDLNSFIQCTRFTAANSIGSTWGDQLAQEEKVKTFIEKYTKPQQERSSNIEISDAAADKNSKRDSRRLSFMLFDPSEVRSNGVVHAGETSIFDTNQGILNVSEDILHISPAEYLAQMSRNPFAFEQCMMDLTRKSMREIFKKYFPYYTPLYNRMRDTMRRLTKYGGLDADTINSLHREFIVYLLSKQKGTAFDGEAPNFSADPAGTISNRQYYTQYFPARIQALKAEGILSDIPFFNALTVSGDAEADSSVSPLEISIQGMGGLQSRSSNLITEAWAEAFNSDKVVHSLYYNRDFSIKELAEGLYFYNFYKLGYNYHPKSSMSLAPTLLKLGLTLTNNTSEIGYIDFINDVIDGNIIMDNNDITSFAKQYILNHLDNKRFVYTPRDIARDSIHPLAYNNEGKFWRKSFEVSLKSLGNEIASQITIKDDSLKGKMKAFRPIIALEEDGSTAYYMANSSEERFNVTSSISGTMTYKLVYAQGIKGQKIQYFGNAAYDAFQATGNLNGYVEKTESKKPKANETGFEDSIGDGDVSKTPEGSYSIEIGTDVSEMFTKTEWQKMFDLFKRDNPDIFSLDTNSRMSLEEFKGYISDTSDSQNVNILNDLINRIDRGEKMQTRDEDGNITEVCPIRL